MWVERDAITTVFEQIDPDKNVRVICVLTDNNSMLKTPVLEKDLLVVPKLINELVIQINNNRA